MEVSSVWSCFCFFFFGATWNVCKMDLMITLTLRNFCGPCPRPSVVHRHLTFLPLPNSHWSGHKNPRQKDKVLLKVKVQTQHNNLLAPDFTSQLTHSSALGCSFSLDIKAQKWLHNLRLINKAHASIRATHATASHRSVLSSAAVTITISRLSPQIYGSRSAGRLHKHETLWVFQTSWHLRHGPGLLGDRQPLLYGRWGSNGRGVDSSAERWGGWQIHGGCDWWMEWKRINYWNTDMPASVEDGEKVHDSPMHARCIPTTWV